MAGLIAFASPWMLAALAALPVLWWLLRVTPPSPRAMRFPAIRLLRQLTAREETPARTPWWLVLLRVVLAGAVILALAGPVLNPRAAPTASGPMVVVVDDGWAAGPDWSARQDALAEIVDLAERVDRPLYLLGTAPAVEAQAPTPLTPTEARRRVETWRPQPWAVDRAAAAESVAALPIRGGSAIWLTDGLGGPGTGELAAVLQRLGSLEAVLPDFPALLLDPPEIGGESMRVRLRRADAAAPAEYFVRADADDGRLLGREPVRFAASESEAVAEFDLPRAVRNDAARLSIEGAASAGAVVLLDERWRAHVAGVAASGSRLSAQPLLNPTYYVERALEPNMALRVATLDELLAEGGVSAIVLGDASLTESEAAALRDWVEKGGALIRFAGPLLAAEPDELTPTRLRLGDRTLGGALSWTQPARLAPFPEGSPFEGLTPPPDVTVTRQVLAEPAVDLGEKTWARLEDGTPLVTGTKLGDGHVALIHTTANADWSNLALSGLFVDMLNRLAQMGAGVATEPAEGALEPLRLLDGFGRSVVPGPEARPIPAAAFAETAPGPEHPPGLYGQGETRRAFNLAPHAPELAPLTELPAGVARAAYAQRGEIPLKPYLLGLALALAAVDLFAALALRGLLGRPRRAATAAALAVAALATLAPSPKARAQDADPLRLAAEGKTLLGYVLTGDMEVDGVSRVGMEGLAQVMFHRTSLEDVAAVPVDVVSDELAFYPLLYWPITPGAAAVSDEVAAKLNAYMRDGGTILFDTRDQGMGADAVAALREATHGLDIPPLEPAPDGHVLGRAFYLLDEFPGRHANGAVWVEAGGSESNDGVSPVIVAGNDYAAAWATDEFGRPYFPTEPGGERQREMARRFGVNLVMYVLTGNYKADQVHVPAILERLGQ